MLALLTTSHEVVVDCGNDAFVASANVIVLTCPPVEVKAIDPNGTEEDGCKPGEALEVDECASGVAHLKVFDLVLFEGGLG